MVNTIRWYPPYTTRPVPGPRFSAQASASLPRIGVNDFGQPRAPQTDTVSLRSQSQPERTRFAVIGDAGTGDAAQYKVSGQMSRWRERLPFSSVLVLGDNVYPCGEPNLFDERIRQPYQKLFQQGVRFYPVLGNHDVKAGFGDQQMKYWGVPPYYSVKLGKPGLDVEVFALDATVLLPGYYGGFQENPQVSAQKESAELRWLDQALASSTASMKVVMGHYPLYAIGSYAKPKRVLWQQSLERKLTPLLQKYQVDLYLGGHEHHYEKPLYLNGVFYALSGAGGKLDKPTKGLPEGNGLIKKNHFMLFEKTDAGLQYRTISADGDVFDFGLIPQRPKVRSSVVPSTPPSVPLPGSWAGIQ